MGRFIESNFFDYKENFRAPNVSQVPKYSPFRFPGGKTWLYPFAKEWVKHYSNKTLIEPFAGGASIGLAAAIEGWVKNIILIEIDPQIYCVWKCIIEGNAKELAKRVCNFDFNESSVEKQIHLTTNNLVDKAFITLLRNRINHGGILANGSGKLKHGEAGKGILSRWYPKTISDRIIKINSAIDKLEVFQTDGIEYINKHSLASDVIFFVDPPYTVAGKRLYDYFEIDHEKLFFELSMVKSPFMLTYDDSPLVTDLINKYNFDYERVLMTTTHHRKKYELIISKDLNWMK